MVEAKGIEPMTPCTSSKCSPAELSLHNNTIITEKPRKIKCKVKKRQPLGCLILYRKNNIDNTNMNKTPATIGTAVRLTILKGVCLVVPATITMTAETGETALNKLPASPPSFVITQEIFRSKNHTQTSIMAL